MKMLCNVNFSTNEKYAKLSKVNLSASKNMYLNIAGDSFPSSEVISTTQVQKSLAIGQNLSRKFYFNRCSKQGNKLLTILFVEHYFFLEFHLRFQSLLNARFVILICLQSVQKVTTTASPHELAPRKTSELAEAITAVHYGVIVLFLSAAKDEVTVWMEISRKYRVLLIISWAISTSYKLTTPCQVLIYFLVACTLYQPLWSFDELQYNILLNKNGIARQMATHFLGRIFVRWFQEMCSAARIVLDELAFCREFVGWLFTGRS